MTPRSERPPRWSGLTLLEAAALVIGYAVAALASRAIWPRSGPISLPTAALAVVCYVWLGLAISGPFLLAVSHGHGRGSASDDEPITRAESAWILIGVYCAALGLLAAITRIHVPPAVSALPLMIGVLFFILRRRRAAVVATRRWTRAAAVIVLMTWPAVWAAWIVLARSFD